MNLVLGRAPDKDHELGAGASALGGKALSFPSITG